MKTDDTLPDTEGRDGDAVYDLPVAQAARSLAICNRPFNENTTLEDMVLALHNANVADGDCETLLFMQARVLDAIFGRLTVKALKAVDSSDDVDDDRMNIALRAQRQSRVTISALSAVQSKKEKARKEEEKFFAKELKERENFW